MKVLLRQNIDKLGKRGQVVEVADGYARNYLFPQKMALKPTPQNVRQLDIEKRRFTQQEAEQKSSMQAIADRLREVSCTIVARADQDGHLYGSVTESMIVDALAEHKIPVEARWIQMEHPIKELGVYSVEVRLHSDIVSQVKVWVVEESGEGAPEKAAEEKNGPAASDGP